MRLIGMLIGFSLVAGFGLWEFHQATAHLQPPAGINPAALAIYALQVKQAIFEEYHLIFRVAAGTLFLGALLAAGTLRPLPSIRWR
jgi:hypothetical protein